MRPRPRPSQRPTAEAGDQGDDAYSTPRAAAQLTGVALPRISRAILTGEARVLRRGHELLVALADVDALAEKGGQG
jgi:hypothetical protein